MVITFRAPCHPVTGAGAGRLRGKPHLPCNPDDLGLALPRLPGVLFHFMLYVPDQGVVCRPVDDPGRYQFPGPVVIHPRAKKTIEQAEAGGKLIIALLHDVHAPCPQEILSFNIVRGGDPVCRELYTRKARSRDGLQFIGRIGAAEERGLFYNIYTHIKVVGTGQDRVLGKARGLVRLLEPRINNDVFALAHFLSPILH